MDIYTELIVTNSPSIIVVIYSLTIWILHGEITQGVFTSLFAISSVIIIIHSVAMRGVYKMIKDRNEQ